MCLACNFVQFLAWTERAKKWTHFVVAYKFYVVYLLLFELNDDLAYRRRVVHVLVLFDMSVTFLCIRFYFYRYFKPVCSVYMNETKYLKIFWKYFENDTIRAIIWYKYSRPNIDWL